MEDLRSQAFHRRQPRQKGISPSREYVLIFKSSVEVNGRLNYQANRLLRILKLLVGWNDYSSADLPS